MMATGFWNEIKYAFRLLVRSPGFTAVAVLILTLGIGANASIFTLVNALLFQPLPVKDPHSLVTVYTSDFSGPLYGSSSYPDFLEWRASNQVFSAMLAHTDAFLLLSTENKNERIYSNLVSERYFEDLGVEAFAGRLFSAEDWNAGAADVAVISHGLWRRFFGSDPSVIGRTVILNGVPIQLIGIAQPEFTGLLRGLSTDLWFPLSLSPHLRPQDDLLQNRGSRTLMVLARMRPDIQIDQAQANMNLIADQLHKSYPGYWTNVKDEARAITVVPEAESRIPPQIRVPVIAFVSLLMIVVGLVLVIACANLGNLLLARATARRREMSIRLALGARRRVLIRQLLIESLLLSLAGATGGILLTLWLNALFLRLEMPLPITLALNLEPDARVLAFTVAVSVITALVFGLAPALASTRVQVVSGLKDGVPGHRSGSGGSLLRKALLVTQVSVALLLLISAGLLLRSLANARSLDLGFDPRNIVVASLDLEPLGLSEGEGEVLYRELEQRLEQLPRVEAAALAASLPLDLSPSRRSVTIEEYQPSRGEDMEVYFNVVTPGFFKVMNLPIVRGRIFTASDSGAAPGVVMVNESFVRRYWPSQEALGKRLAPGRVEPGSPLPLQVVGVVRDSSTTSMTEAPPPFIYFNQQQEFQPFTSLLVRTGSTPSEFHSILRSELRSLNPRLIPFVQTTLEEHLAIFLFPARLAGFLLIACGALATVLTIVGVYGVMAFAVARRTREIGIRMALGADRDDVIRLIVRQGLVLTVIGTVIGLGLAMGVTRFLEFLLYGVDAIDPLVFAAVPALLVIVILMACYFPARRAGTMDPLASLRCD